MRIKNIPTNQLPNYF